MVAHRSQLHALPAGLEPKAGVLADPLAVASHAVDRACAATGSGPIVVLGAGTIGLCVLAALRHRFPEARPLVTAAWPHSRLRVEALGAVAVAPSPDGVVAAVAGLTGEEPVRPWRGGRWLRKGAAVVIDTIGSSATLGLALRIAGRRARIVKVGVGRAGRVDWTLAYVKEVDVLGSNGYGRGAIPAAVEMLAAGEVPHAGWLTHTFPLAQWRRAFETARRPGRNQAIKVVVEVCP
jgi:threonine dehydrogenase-like Zn-dependent dehydrogenase